MKVQDNHDKVLDLKYFGLELKLAKLYFFFPESNTTEFLTLFKLTYIFSTPYGIKPKTFLSYFGISKYCHVSQSYFL